MRAPTERLQQINHHHDATPYLGTSRRRRRLPTATSPRILWTSFLFWLGSTLCADEYWNPNHDPCRKWLISVALVAASRQESPIRRPLFIPRGGADDVDDGNENDENNENSNEVSPGKEKSFFSWIFGDDTGSERWPGPVSHNASRGGALVKARTTWRSRWAPWLPLDAIAAPLAARVRLEEDDVSQDRIATPSPQYRHFQESVRASAQSVRRVWWVDTWADHILYDDDDDEEEGTVPIEAEEPEDEVIAVVNERDEPGVPEVATPVEPEVDRMEGSLPSAPVTPADVRPEVVHSPSGDYSLWNRPAANQTRLATSSPYTSSGYWQSIDRALTLGYAVDHPDWRVSSHLRSLRKTMAHVTGLHGVLSGKPSAAVAPVNEDEVEDASMGMLRRRLAAIDRARRNLDRLSVAASAKERKRFFWQQDKKEEVTAADESSMPPQYETETVYKTVQERQEEERRKMRVNEIDQQMQAAQQRLMELACEKDVLQQRPNPLWNYTTESTNDQNTTVIAASRDFNFPPPDLVDEYLDMLFATGRLIKMNHTDLWRNGEDEAEDDEELLARGGDDPDRRMRRTNGNGGSGGSWLLRNGLGEKIGETAETAAYKAVCAALMSVLARSISSLHGVNVMKFSDIRLYREATPDLPPLTAGLIHGSSRYRNYAQDAFRDVLQRGAKRRKRSVQSPSAFIQRDAIVETLTSQCQIAAPLLKLFPLAWQRALLGNIVDMCTAIIADFCEGIEFQILGHRLSFAFTPITEEDMMRGLMRDRLRPHRPDPEAFEAAVRATADDVGDNLKFLDRWHERALGSGLLRTQIATLIARLVLTLTDDVLSGSRMDLWTAHAGGPRLLAALEYRSIPSAEGSGDWERQP